MKRSSSGLLLLLAVLLAACGTPRVSPQSGAIEAINTDAAAGFARVTAPRPFTFPADHGAHPAYQTEWWYYTGNLTDDDGQPYGFQLTFFRRGLTASPTPRSSAWAADSIYLAHFAVTDVTNGQFYHTSRVSRGAAGLAGATADPFRVFLEDWQVTGDVRGEPATMRLQAADATTTDGGDVALDLRLTSTKPPVLQGDRGFSQKGREAGQASYYYSFTRMAATGTLTLGDTTLDVRGLAWMDHEWGTQMIDAAAIGWDWFSAQLDDGRELMYAEIRRDDAAAPVYRYAVLIDAQGTPTVLDADTARLTVTDEWQSPASGATYPSAWQLALPAANIDLTIRPLIPNQEHTGTIVYWEGAVAYNGTQRLPDGSTRPLVGTGYVELTGYAEAQQARF